VFTHAAKWGDTHRQSEDAWLDGLIADQEGRRPIFFMESDGSIVRASDHFDYTAWDQGPHWSKVLSPDRLGRDVQKWELFNGEWTPNDEEHDVSALWLAHDVKINDSETSRLTLEMGAEHLIARHTMPSTKPKWSTNGYGAGRAVGRTMLNVAENYLATGNLKLLLHVYKKWTEVIEPLYATPKEVNVYRVIGGDDRVFGGKKDGWVVWEDAIFVMGADALAVVLREAGMAAEAGKVQRIVDMITLSIVEYGFMPDASNPMILKLVSWELKGQKIPSEWYKDTKKEFIEDSFNTDFTTWARPALDIAMRWSTSEESRKKAAAARADTLLTYLGGSMDLYRVAKYAGLK